MRNSILIVTMILAVASFAVGYKLAQREAVEVVEPVSAVTSELQNFPESTGVTDETLVDEFVALVQEGAPTYGDLYSLASRMDASMVEQSLESTLRILPDYLGLKTSKVLLTRLVELDPTSAFDVAHELVPVNHVNYNSLMAAVYREVALIDAVFAWESIGRLRVRTQAQAKAYLISRVITDEKLLVRFRDELTPEEFSWLNRMETEQMSPQELMLAAQGIENSQERMRAYMNALTRWAIVDPATALANVPPELEGRVLSSVRERIFVQWAKKNAVAALSAAMSGETPDRYIGAVLREYAQQDVQAAMRLIEQYDLHHLSGRVVGTWANVDVEATARYYESLDEKTQEMVGLSSIASAFLNSDPDRAFVWLEEVGASPQELWSVMNDYAENDPAKARLRVDQLPPGDTRSSLISTLISSQLRTDPEATLDYLKSLGADDLRANLRNVVGRWAREDFAAALVYANKIDDTELRQQGLLSVLRNGSSVDYLDEKLALLEDLDTKYRDPAIESIMVYHARAYEWHESLALIEQIENKRLREGALARAISVVGSTDKPRALEIVREQGLQDDPQFNWLREDSR